MAGSEPTSAAQRDAQVYLDEFVAPASFGSIMDLLWRMKIVLGAVGDAKLSHTILPSLIDDAYERAQALRVPFGEALHNPESRHYMEPGRYGS